MSEQSQDPVTEDRLLGQRVRLSQPRSGYRAAVDPVLLAAAVEARRGALVLDAGMGTGAVALCLLARRPDLTVIGIERDAEICRLAQANAAANAMAGRITVRCGHLEAVVEALAGEGVQVDGVVTNPPYLAAERADPSPSAGRRDANVESFDLAAWIRTSVRVLRRKGAVTLVHRADRLDDAILALRQARCGEIAVLPLWPHRGEPARRVIVRARKDVAGPARLLPGLVLHNPDGSYTPEAEAVLRDAAALPWKSSTLPSDCPS